MSLEKPIAVVETFFSVEVRDMERATAFYVAALGARVSFAMPRWTSIHVAGVRIGLALADGHAGGRNGLHFAVNDLASACAAIERARGRVITPSIEVAPGVVIAEVQDTERNTFVLDYQAEGRKYYSDENLDQVRNNLTEYSSSQLI